MGIWLSRAAVFAFACLIGAGTAKAGGAGGASTNAMSSLQSTCTSIPIPCPSFPTMNQTIVELAALTGVTPATVRSNLMETAPPFTFDGGTISGTSVPVGFLAGAGHQPIPTNLSANSFLAATTTGLTTLDLTYDFTLRKNPFAPGQTVGDLVLPFLVTDASQNNLSEVPAMLQLVATGSGVDGTITGDFTGTPTTFNRLSDLGIDGSLNFASGSLELNLDIPLLIPADFVQPTGYGFSTPGHEFDMTNGLFDGIDPFARFNDASFVDDSGNLIPAVHADLAIAIDASTVLSTALPEPTGLAVFGVGFCAIWILWRRRAESSEG